MVLAPVSPIILKELQGMILNFVAISGEQTEMELPVSINVEISKSGEFFILIFNLIKARKGSIVAKL